ncbi:DNA polymerase III subunit epsilon [Streptomyces bambusae]|uniref:exonuclease domain-containing protein n=1 Tax=Streptomyces bambusae TaxID=1550616 RepID=UPI001CFD77C1|nr:exonuclease domain-containing protein [Streptomyces bambusae]MCB5168047.1 DNA polymerase III subunit epsilon [Streptomyces bambusae]
MSWHLGRMAALDFESSDKDHATARIVTCALILISGGLPTDTRTWLLAPGIPMEPEAIAVHGITDEYAAEHGQPANQGVMEIVTALSEVVAAGVPIVGHNIGRYDLNLLCAESRRHLGGPLTETIPDAGDRMRVIDTMVLDKQAAPYRRRVSETQGPYQMRTTAETYGLAWDEAAAHGAEYDALMSARAAWRMGQIAHLRHQDRPEWVRRLRTQRFSSLAVGLDELHTRQAAWAREDAIRFQAYLRDPAKAGDKHDPAAVIDPHWPLIPHQQDGDL